MEVKVERLEHELIVERECKEALQVELDGVTKKHAVEKDKVTPECHDQVDSTIREHWVAIGSFDVHKVDLDALVGMDISELGFDMLCLSSAAWDSFMTTRKNSLDFYLEEDPTNANMVPSTANEDITPINNDAGPTVNTNQCADGENEGNVF
ncbi:hypothetical protein GOBAR_AA17040 [Gossypium barbadense]|uniref:Uncharacterized protein n=1 Tax=Gossypium barbadense TaxID=3634 RepID=A0A2P5XJW6_GOSBA|nr:hypothetical protein GOBAR_AA17040 [Gossypium barbadense]